jgi:hypothetical protein
VNELLDGDYNHNNSVDAADYTVWADRGLGSIVVRFSAGDGNGNGVIDSGDYAIWRNNFGNSAPGGGAAASTIVQEDEPTANVPAVEEATAVNDASVVRGVPIAVPMLAKRTAVTNRDVRRSNARHAETHDIALLSLFANRRRTTRFDLEVVCLPSKENLSGGPAFESIWSDHGARANPGSLSRCEDSLHLGVHR